MREQGRVFRRVELQLNGARAGGAAVCLEDELTVDVMAAALKALLSKPERLEKMAAGARSAAKPNAAEELADLVEKTAR